MLNNLNRSCIFMKRNYLIRDGFRNRVIHLCSMPKVRLGIGVMFVGLLALMFWFADVDHDSGTMFAEGFPLMYGLKFDKQGLSDDNLKFVNDLEKRIKMEPDSNAKSELTKLLNEATKEMTEFATRFKDLDQDKINLLKELLGADEKSIRSIMVKQGEALKKLQDKLDQGPEDLSVRSQIVKWRDSNKDALVKLKNKEQATLSPLEIRLNSPMTAANTLNASAYIPRPEFESGATDIVRPKLTFWDTLTKGRTSSSVYVWVNKKNPAGAAAFIGPGIAKPGVSLELASEISNAKKVAASEKVALELLEDIEGFASYIEQELKFQVDKATNTALMTGVLSATVPAGIRTLSTTYTLAGVSTTNPNYWDVIRAVVAQLRAGNLEGAVTVFINPVDKANMDLTKAISQGQLFVPGQPDATIIEDNNIPVGFFQAAILQYYNVKIYKDYTVTYGWENDDFTKNLVTLVGERRLHVYSKQNYTGFAIYDSFANVQAAIAAA